MWRKTNFRDRIRLPKLKHPIIILNDKTYTVLFHARKCEVSFRGLWYAGDFMTDKPYGKVHDSIGRKVCYLTNRTVGLIDSYGVPRKNHRDDIFEYNISRLIDMKNSLDNIMGMNNGNSKS